MPLRLVVKNPKSIRWATFFSDCEHEVPEITEGHRLTLTYNLHWTGHGPSLMATHLSALDQPSLHFYAVLEKIIKCPSFLPNGGLIGFSCTHGYPHTSQSAIRELHRTLKGLDMVVYQALQRLVGSTKVQAVLDASEYDEYIREREYDSNDSTTSSDNGAEDPLASKHYLSTSLPSTHLQNDEQHDGLDPTSIEVPALHYNDPNDTDVYELAFDKQKITWVNGSPQSFKEVAVAFIAYGNQASMDAYYSTAVIISELPGHDKRNA